MRRDAALSAGCKHKELHRKTGTKKPVHAPALSFGLIVRSRPISFVSSDGR